MDNESGLDALKVKFTHSNTVRDKRPFTIYEIEVRSVATITWVIYKRYSHFYTLHQELSKHHSAASHVRLPHLPPKRLTRSLAAEFVEKRKQELQEYLREILSVKELRHSTVLLKFLEVPDTVRGLIIRPTSTHPSDDTSFFSLTANPHQSYEEKKVVQLITLLEVHPNRVSAIKSFESYFFEHRPRLSNGFIRQLFQGKLSGSGEGGLVQTCGDFSYSHVASRAALYLLCRLLDVEKNKDAHLFLDQFTNLPTNVLAKMQLHLHILSERGNRLGAFKIVSLLRRANGHKGQFRLEEIVVDTWAQHEYYKWSERNTMTETGVTNKEPQEVTKKSLNLNEHGPKKIAEETFNEIYKIAKDGDPRDWRIVTPLAQKEIPDMNVSICYKKDVIKDMIILKLTTIMPFSADQLLEFLMDFNSYKKWDPKFHDGKVVLKIPNSQSDVCHMVFKTSSSPYRYRDFCLLRSGTKKENGECLVGVRSVLHPRVAEAKRNIRAVLFPTGYVITPVSHDEAQKVVKKLHMRASKERDSVHAPLSLGLGSSSTSDIGQINSSLESKTRRDASLPIAKAYCHITYVAQMDKESSLIVSPDLLGESTELIQSMKNIKTCLFRKYPKARPPPKAPSVPLARNNTVPLDKLSIATPGRKTLATKPLKPLKPPGTVPRRHTELPRRPPPRRPDHAPPRRGSARMMPKVPKPQGAER